MGFGSCLSCVSEIHDAEENTKALLRLGTSEVKTGKLVKNNGSIILEINKLDTPFGHFLPF